tara:strand:- start:389 stop:607 length:219 start_codon:yes stop_codon:yes gene_type:complete
MGSLVGLFLGFFKMNLGIIFLKANVLGFITLEELDWITENENSFSRIDMALVIKLGRLMDKGIIEIDCRRTA